MIISFSLQNYRSFKERQVLNLHMEQGDELHRVDVAGVPATVAGVFAAGGAHHVDAVELQPGRCGDVALKLLAARKEQAEQKETEN